MESMEKLSERLECLKIWEGRGARCSVDFLEDGGPKLCT